MSALSCVQTFQTAKLSGYLSVRTLPDLTFDRTDHLFLHETYYLFGS